MSNSGTTTIKARELRVDDLIQDEEGLHEVTNVSEPYLDTLGVTCHGEDKAGGEFVYQLEQLVTVVNR